MTNNTNTPATLEPYRVRDLAKLIGCSDQHVRNMVTRNEVPGAFRLGKLIRFQRDLVDRWLAARVQTGGG